MESQKRHVDEAIDRFTEDYGTRISVGNGSMEVDLSELDNLSAKLHAPMTIRSSDDCLIT